MAITRCLLATILLVYSGQSPALFMPDGFSVNTDNTSESDGGCGVAATGVNAFRER